MPNLIDDAIDILADLDRRESAQGQAEPIDPNIAGSIACFRFWSEMIFAVDLDYQTGFATVKVGDVRTEWMLAPEFDVEFLIAKSGPE